MRRPRCPRCESTEPDLDACSAELHGFNETVVSTHECKKCRCRFRDVPPELTKEKQG